MSKMNFRKKSSVSAFDSDRALRGRVVGNAEIKTPLPWREGIKGRGTKKVIMHPHPSPLPSKERAN
jgi:hypothetical protein